MLDVVVQPDMPVYRCVVASVHDGLRQGRLLPNETLPARSRLAKTLGVSPTTIRQAYELLQQQGIVTARHGSGTTITADAMLQLQQLTVTGRRNYRRIYMVIGQDQLTACDHERVYLFTSFMTGMQEIFGNGPTSPRFVFVRSFTRECLHELTDDDAVILLGTRKSEIDLFDELTARNVPVLGLWGLHIELLIPNVYYEPLDAATLACEHLVECGYKRMGFIGVKDSNTTPLGRKFLAFSNVLHQAGLDYRAAHVRQVINEPGRAYKAMQDIIATGDLPDAIFADTDAKAIEAIHALKDAGYHVPEDVGVMGYSDLPEAAKANPPLSTVRTPRQAAGRRAGELLGAWSADNRPRQHMALPSTLVVRQSTARVKKSRFAAARDHSH